MENQHYRIPFPVEVSSNKNGYEFLANVASLTSDFGNCFLELDFRDCIWFEGNLCAVLGNILQGLKDRGNTFTFTNVNSKVKGAISRNGFLQQFQPNEYFPKIYHTSIPYKRFKLEEEKKVKEFIKTELFDKEGMPLLSPAAKKAILINIFEICVNAITHGGCEFVYCCGQIFPEAKVPKVLISFVDLGRTIRSNVNNYLHMTLSGSRAIIWALEDGNTTKSGTEPGGLGLKLLQNLIKLNKGKLQIVSGDGFIEIKNGSNLVKDLNIVFPGTIVSIELSLQDTNFYKLQSEANSLNDIF